MILQVRKIFKLLQIGDFGFSAYNIIFSNAAVRTYIKINFGKQAFCYENDDENETEIEVAAAFLDIWHTFIENEQLNLEKIGRAIYMEYNPIENYDRTEHETNNTKHKNDILTMQKGTTTTTTYGQYEENIAVSTYEAAEKDERTTTKGHRPNSSDIEGVSGQNTDTTQYGDIDVTRDSHISGNVGVTTSQQMLLSEYQVRQFNLLHEVCNKFIRLYCFTYWGDC